MSKHNTLPEAVAKVGDVLEKTRLPTWTAQLDGPTKTLGAKLDAALSRLTDTRPFRTMIQPRPMTPEAQRRLALIAKRDKDFIGTVDLAVERFQEQATAIIQKAVSECFEWAFLELGETRIQHESGPGREFDLTLTDAEKKIVDQLRADNGLTVADNVLIILEGTEERIMGNVISAVSQKPTLDMVRQDARLRIASLVGGLRGRLDMMLQGFCRAAFLTASREIFGARASIAA